MNLFIHYLFCLLVGAESKVPVGILEVRLELIPKLNELVGEEVISAQVSLEKNRQAEKERLFLVYAKQWWKEYLQIRPHHKERLVKIFAQVIDSCIKHIRHIDTIRLTVLGHALFVDCVPWLAPCICVYVNYFVRDF